MKILIVDDREEDRLLLLTMLRGAGYETVEADDGQKALEIALREKVDLIISDILMPRMDGFRLCHEVKTRQQLMAIPFIFYSATYVENEDEEFALSLGAESFIVKPKDPEEFLKIVREILKDYGLGYKPKHPSLSLEEGNYLRQYLERLIKKLDDKVRELEESNKALKSAKEAIEHEKERLAVTLAAKERLDLTLHSIGDAIMAVDHEGKIIFMNKIAEEMTGLNQGEALGKPLAEVFLVKDELTGAEQENPWPKAMVSGQQIDLKDYTLLVSLDGQERCIAGNIVTIPPGQKKHLQEMVLVFRDITEKKKQAKEAERASKLESIGFLAGGLAHDLNNMLTTVMGSLSLAKMMEPAEDEIRGILTDGEQAAEKAKALLIQLVTFAKGGLPIKKKVFLTQLIKDTVASALRNNQRDYVLSLPENLWAVEADEGQLRQVINNLIINADQAMPAGQGIIMIQAENIQFTEVKMLEGIKIPAGDYLKISIIDQGIGLPKEDLLKIFDPYFTFTTKRDTSGLGLAVAYSIIKNHRGYLTVSSEKDRGTTFSLYIPALPGSDKEKQINSSQEKMADQPREKIEPGSQGRILIVDDQPLVRKTLVRMLAHFGYEAEEAKDGVEALDLFNKAKAAHQPFDALILDLIIPGCPGGEEILQQLMDIDPKVKAIASSGYANDPIMAHFQDYGFSACLNKPFTSENLKQVLSQLIQKKIRTHENPI